MWISELSERTGIPVPRIKYYIREGLLARGAGNEAKRAEYDESHVRRLRLIRALVTVGGMSIAHARMVLDEIDEPPAAPMDQLGIVFGALAESASVTDDEYHREAQRRLDAVIETRGWRPAADDPARLSIITAMATMIELGHGRMLDHLDVYAKAAEQVAVADLESIAGADDLTTILERSIVGSLLGEVFIRGLRRLAHGQIAARMIESSTPPFTGDPEDGRRTQN